MNWYVVNNEYVEFLKQFDNKVPDVNYGVTKIKCFLGLLTGISNKDYLIPLSSYQPKYEHMKDNIDFYKVADYNNQKIYAALDINNMIPVPAKECYVVTRQNLPEFRLFRDTEAVRRYWGLLCTEKRFIDEDKIKKSAKKLYELVKKHPNSNIAKRCCDFLLLEEKMDLYNSYNAIS